MFFRHLGSKAKDKGGVMAPLVVFKEIKARCAGLDVVAVLYGNASWSIVVEGQVPFAGEEVAVGVTVAKARLSPLHTREPHAELEHEDVQHSGAVFTSTPKHDGVAKFAQPILGATQCLIYEVCKVVVH